MTETTIITPANRIAIPARAPAVLPNLIPSNIPQVNPPAPPPSSAIAGERLSFDAPPGLATRIRHADASVNIGGAIKASQNQIQLILNGGNAGSDPPMAGGNGFPQALQLVTGGFSGSGWLQYGQFIGVKELLSHTAVNATSKQNRQHHHRCASEQDNGPDNEPGENNKPVQH